MRVYKVCKNADNVKDCRERARTAKQAGIAEGTTVTAANVRKREDTERPYVLSHLEVCGKKTWVHVLLCSV